MVKIAIMAELMNRRDEIERYEEAYTSIRFRFSDISKTNIDIFKFEQIR